MSVLKYQIFMEVLRHQIAKFPIWSITTKERAGDSKGMNDLPAEDDIVPAHGINYLVFHVVFSV